MTFDRVAACTKSVIIAFRLKSAMGLPSRAAGECQGFHVVIIAFRLKSAMGPRVGMGSQSSTIGSHNRLSAEVRYGTCRSSRSTPSPWGRVIIAFRLKSAMGREYVTYVEVHVDRGHNRLSAEVRYGTRRSHPTTSRGRGTVIIAFRLKSAMGPPASNHGYNAPSFSVIIAFRLKSAMGH